jgi:hypothetical protein
LAPPPPPPTTRDSGLCACASREQVWTAAHVGDPTHERLDFTTVRLSTHKGEQACAEIEMPASAAADGAGAAAAK